MGQVTTATKRQLLERDEARCTASELPGACWGPLDAGHIIGRGMGGSDRYDTVQWLLLQCRGHNGAIEDNPEVAAAAARLGMHLRRNSTAQLPERAVVVYPDGHAYYLNTDGTKERVTNVPWHNCGKDHCAQDRHPDV